MSGDRSWERVPSPAPGEPVVPYVHEAAPDDETVAQAQALVDLARLRLGPLEAELLELHHLQRRSIRSIAAIYGVTPKAVRYRLGRARRRLRAAVELELLRSEDVWDRATAALAREDALIVATFAVRRSQAAVSRQLGRSRGYVTYRLTRALEELRAVDAGLATYLDQLLEGPHRPGAAAFRGERPS